MKLTHMTSFLDGLLVILLLIFIGLICRFIVRVFNKIATDEDYKEYSEFIYSIGISIVAGSLVSISYSSKPINNFEVFSIVIGFILIAFKNKIKEKSIIFTILSSIIFIAYIVYLLYIKYIH